MTAGENWCCCSCVSYSMRIAGGVDGDITNRGERPGVGSECPFLRCEVGVAAAERRPDGDERMLPVDIRVCARIAARVLCGALCNWSGVKHCSSSVSLSDERDEDDGDDIS